MVAAVNCCVSARHILSFFPNLEFFLINDLFFRDTRAQAQVEFFGLTLTQKPGSTFARAPTPIPPPNISATQVPKIGNGMHENANRRRRRILVSCILLLCGVGNVLAV